VPFPINILSKEFSMSQFSKQVATAARQARDEAKRMAAKATLLKHHAVKEAFDLIPLNLRNRSTVSLSCFSPSVFINVVMYDLNSFKDKKFTNILERFIDWETTTNDYTMYAPNRDVRFDKKEFDHKVGSFTISVQVMAYVKEDSPLCRIVTTGFTEEVVRKEIKQIVCA
jgi:hypothetical protein